MAQVQQVPPTMNGLTEKNGNGMNHDDESSSSAGISHIQNGSVMFHATPTKEMNGASTSVDDLQLSPSDLRRRSTRASALKAQEKIKLKDDIVQGPPQKRINEDEEDGVEGESKNADGDTDDIKGSTPKKRRLEDGREFDQTCFRFGLRANDDGEVYAMTDESENSSLHESEMEVVRYQYEKMKNREPDAEQLRERLKMKREAENALRNEEAQLMVLKRMRDSQNRAITKLAAETKAADMAEVAAAFKPNAAGATGKISANGKNQTFLTAQKTIAGLANLPTQQQLDLLGKLASQSPAAKQAYILAKKNPSQTTQLFAQLIQLNSLQIQKQKESEAAQASQAQSQVQAQVQQVHQQQQQQVQITQQKLINQQTPAQRIQAARVAFRTQADKQLMGLQTFKQQPHDITFLPNPNASAFMALHGLDIVVQHVLKDNSFYTRYTGPTYECEECKTDCSPTWKAIGSAPDDLHLYCESCVRAAQKRKNRQDTTATMKRAFLKIAAQEKEFDKKIAEGQLELFAEAKAAVQQPMAHSSSSSSLQQIPTSSTATVSSTPLGPRLPNMPSSSGTSTPTHSMKSSTPHTSTPKSSSTSSANAKKTMTPMQVQQQMMQVMSNQMKNPAMLQQMLQMYMTQAALSTPQGQQALRNMPMNGMTPQQQQQITLMFAQAQAMHTAQQQAATQQAAQAQAQREAREAREAQQAAAQARREAAREAQLAQQQQAQQTLILRTLFPNGDPTPQMAQQAVSQLQKLTPAQKAAFFEAFRKQNPGVLNINK